MQQPTFLIEVCSGVVIDVKCLTNPDSEFDFVLLDHDMAEEEGNEYYDRLLTRAKSCLGEEAYSILLDHITAQVGVRYYLPKEMNTDNERW